MRRTWSQRGAVNVEADRLHKARRHEQARHVPRLQARLGAQHGARDQGQGNVLAVFKNLLAFFAREGADEPRHAGQQLDVVRIKARLKTLETPAGAKLPDTAENWETETLDAARLTMVAFFWLMRKRGGGWD